MAQLIGSRGIGEASNSAINSLMSLHDGQSVVVSKYVTRSLVSSVSDTVVDSARSMMPDNPVWQGWVSEFQFISGIHKRTSLWLKNADNTLETWRRDDNIFLKLSQLHVLGKKVIKGSWYLPPKWNQECYDAIQMVSEHKVRVVQVTDAESHSCKLKYLIPILQVLNVYVVDFVYVCGYKNFERFAVIDPITSKSQSVIATEERNQYLELMKAITVIQNANRQGSDEENMLIPDANIEFRKVCFQDSFGQILTNE